LLDGGKENSKVSVEASRFCERHTGSGDDGSNLIREYAATLIMLRDPAIWGLVEGADMVRRSDLTSKTLCYHYATNSVKIPLSIKFLLPS
jgi:hypothetical protein